MRPFPAFVLTVLLAAGTPAALASSPSAEPGAVRAAGGADGGAAGGDTGPRVPQTSDGVRGAIAAEVPSSLRSVRRTSIVSDWRVAPGVRATVWDEHDARGRIRAYLLAVDWRRPGVRLDYASAGSVQATSTMSRMVARSKAVAGVNGDFFDIGDTGAPLGIGRDRDRGLLHGLYSGWNGAFSLDAKGEPDIGILRVRGRIAQRPDIVISHVNSPEVAVDGIGLYTRAWGRASGTRWTNGQTSGVRMAVVRDGRVVRTSTVLPSRSPIDGQILVGRGAGARKLASLRRGARVTISTAVEGRKRMVITGNRFLVRDGRIEAEDDRELHPRTAIGIDRDTHQILLLVIDGRQSFSRGYTMVELADKMIDLGADEALNLDGGGSSTMVAARRNGRLGVINSPSDGSQRLVPNGVEVSYRAPR